MATLRTVQTMVPAPPNVKGVFIERCTYREIWSARRMAPARLWRFICFSSIACSIAFSNALSPFRVKMRDRIIAPCVKRVVPDAIVDPARFLLLKELAALAAMAAAAVFLSRRRWGFPDTPS